jgi:ABC-type multidrug transport system ATPase subunit
MNFQLKKWTIRRNDEVHIGPMDFSMQSGEIISLMGPSGCGKSTWLMALLGYEELGLTITGERLQYGSPLSPGSVPSRALYIPQNLPFNPSWELQGFLCRLPWGKPTILNTLFPVRKKRIQRVREVLTQLGLTGREHATVAELSGGEAQRAAVAQILLLSPQLLVGDEFVSGLDPGMAAWILDRCRQNLESSGGTALFALHDVQTALRISDRILIILPPKIDTQPWQIQRNTPAWQGNVLYTVLCLARYAKDLPPSNSVRHLLMLLKIWLNNEQELNLFLTQHEKEAVLEIDHQGNFNPLDAATHYLPAVNMLLHSWTEMVPVRIDRPQRTYIGITIPQVAQKRSLTLLASLDTTLDHPA